ncbi:hypothetical protein [uncultured Flavobacterium sp.]|uniref:hypothetical protein n=1 Tax=uncultured Flavobacterium sp. TaxID=165435 RepID=UPI0025DFBD7C|nr:hypothetical protein [uncultured Flavobacterium sp.]
MITINNGAIFINGTQTTDPELIGCAVLDFAETTEDDSYAIHLKDEDVFIENKEENNNK